MPSTIAATLDSGTPRPCDDDVRAALDRLLSSTRFDAPERRRAFLKFVVEEKLRGRASELKAFTIANAVFGRDESFDSKSDPVVRMEARRLRRDLDSYYVEAGAHDPVRISIPKGGYAPSFEFHGDAATPTVGGGPATRYEVETNNSSVDEGLQNSEPEYKPGRRTTRALTFLLVLAVVGVAGIFVARWQGDSQATPDDSGFPKLAVLPFETSDDTEVSRTLTTGLSWELIRNFKKYDGLRVYQPLDPDETSAMLRNPDRNRGLGYVIRGQVMTTERHGEISIQLLDVVSNEVLWAKKYDVELNPDSIMDTRDAISGQIASLIAQPYGPLAANIEDIGSRFLPGSLDNYLCVLRAHQYRRAFSAEEFRPVLSCLQATVERQPEYTDALALLAWMHLDAARYDFPGMNDRTKEIEIALELANRASELTPENVLSVVLSDQFELVSARAI